MPPIFVILPKKHLKLRFLVEVHPETHFSVPRTPKKHRKSIGFVVVSAPGLGDGIQAIKAGILEIADIHVVNKSDRPDANKTITDLTQMLATNLPDSSENNWTTPILPVSASNDHGVADLLKALEEHHAFLQSSGEIVGRRRRIAVYRILKTVRGFM